MNEIIISLWGFAGCNWPPKFADVVKAAGFYGTLASLLRWSFATP